MNQPILSSETISLRWINCQCFEIRLPNGKTLITDPCYDYPENPNDQIADLFRLKGFTTDDITACDYIILNHTHADHMTNLEELVNRFHPTVICHSGVAAEIAQVCNEMFLTDLYPVDYDGTYYLDGFRLETFHGTHKSQRMTWTSGMKAPDGISQSEKLKRLHTMGSFFNMNFVITLENGFRMAFIVTQFMLNRAVNQIFTPICLLTCQSLGANPIGLLLLVSAGSLTAFLTPMATPAVAMCMKEGGYDLKSIFKSGAVITVLLSVVYIFYTMTVYPAF